MNSNTLFFIFQNPPALPADDTEIYTIPIDNFLSVGIITALIIGGYFFSKHKK